MTGTSTALPPALVAEAMSVVGQAFTAIRSATSQHYAMGERLAPERLAAVGMLADALHNVPDLIRCDPPHRRSTSEAALRGELDVAIGAIEFLHSRGPFVPRGPFQADRVHRILPLAPAPCRDGAATSGDPRRAEGGVSWIGALAAACGLVGVYGLGRRLRS